MLEPGGGGALTRTGGVNHSMRSTGRTGVHPGAVVNAPAPHGGAGLAFPADAGQCWCPPVALVHADRHEDRVLGPRSTAGGASPFTSSTRNWTSWTWKLCASPSCCAPSRSRIAPPSAFPASVGFSLASCLHIWSRPIVRAGATWASSWRSSPRRTPYRRRLGGHGVLGGLSAPYNAGMRAQWRAAALSSSVVAASRFAGAAAAACSVSMTAASVPVGLRTAARLPAQAAPSVGPVPPRGALGRPLTAPPSTGPRQSQGPEDWRSDLPPHPAPVGVRRAGRGRCRPGRGTPDVLGRVDHM